VRVIHLESVADPAPPGQPYGQPWVNSDREQRGQLYADSIESLMRNVIQKGKVEMAAEVIDAGRFDQKTTMAERKETLEQLLQVGRGM
jgi:SWI/SNF-related matrix-associated actin-dependent regulator of chromatin subfamily A protein 2/4